MESVIRLNEKIVGVDDVQEEQGDGSVVEVERETHAGPEEDDKKRHEKQVGEVGELLKIDMQ